MNNLKLDYSVIRLDDKPISDVLNSREVVESFKQFNLDSSLEIVKFGYIGPEVVIYDDYVKLIKSIFSNSEFTSSLKIFGTTKEVDIEIEIEELCTSVTSLDFFDCLDKVAPNGYIRGCYDEVYDRITVGDELREMLLNDQSINSTVFSDNDKKQFIYQIFRLVATGGPLCQPDISTQRDSKTNQTKMPSRVFHIKRVSSFQLFSDPDCSHSRLFIIIDPFLKHVRVIKNDYKSFCTFSKLNRVNNYKMQKNPSFSATAKEAAEKRFPEGTVDWFLSSDFNVDYESVKVLDLIAKGSYGTVYKALWNGEVVAAKLEDFTDGDEEQVNLLVELTMLQSFPHERLVRFLGAGCLSNDQGSYIERKLMIVMEYCERGALRECLREKLPWNLRTRISLDICHGISFLHDNSIIHRDIKSTNVLIDSAWRAKLCDFSFACHNDSTSKKDLTYGTDEFMSPEVACALDFDMSADIFSYGIVLCEIITGKEPSNQFMCRKPQDLFALNEKEVKNVVLGDCPPQLEALAFACCDIEPRKRPTANICSEELTEILNNLGGPEFEYVPPDKAKLPNSPNPFREGKVRISVGGPGHENDNGRYGVNTPQGRRSFLSDDQLNNRLLELEKQVVELKEENLKLHNMVHKLSPILGSHNDLKDGIAVVSSHRNSNISTPDDVNRTWHSVYSNSSSNSTLNDLAGYEPNTIHTRLSILEQKIRIIYDANMISPVRDMILDDDDDGLMNKSLSETFLMEESDELGANKDGDNSMVLSSESLKNELRQVYKLKSQIDSITNNLEQKVITAVKSRKPNHFTTPSNKLSKGNATNNRTPITTNITKSKENDDPYENPNTVRPRLWPNSSLKKNENHTTKPPRHSVSSVESNKSPRSSSGGNIGGNTNTKKANPTEISKSSKSHNTPQSSNVHLSEALNNFLSVVKTTKITDEMTHNIISSIENTLFSNTSENQLKNDETYLQYHSPPPGGSLTDHRQIIPVDIKKTWRDVDHPIKSKMKDSPNVELTDIIATMIDENV